MVEFTERKAAESTTAPFGVVLLHDTKSNLSSVKPDKR